MQLKMAHGQVLDLAQPKIMGVLNVTPDSFSDGGKFSDLSQSLAHAEQMIDEGVDIIDVGGESTRPGAKAVTSEEEFARVLPVVTALSKMGVLISVDTSNPALMSAVVSEGAHLLNDVRSFRREGALEAAAASDAALCVMHMQGEPGTMQNDPHYDDVGQEVLDDLLSSKARLLQAGVDRNAILLDPGFGFGKNTEHNISLFKSLSAICQHAPVLIGVSRKRLIGDLTGVAVDQRDPASAWVAALSVDQGARVVRTHNVGLTRQVLQVMERLR
ncbi:MAG: dihydropteroate synthase [Gammaproteobacteria bacterium]|nr:dihydropteroate synthase [Gammaproteobacteria bacterium]